MNQKKNFDNLNNFKNFNLENKDIDVVILCGGLGKRLKPLINDQPKVLAKIGNMSFLDILINNILPYGFKNIILCVGHLKEQIKKHYNNCFYCRKDCNIMYSEEEEPLGTGGALNNAKLLINSDPFMVMNGDSICNIDFNQFVTFHKRKNAILSIVLSMSMMSKDIYKDYGVVTIDNSRRIINFDEKPIENKESLINAGIYLMKKDIFSYMSNIKTFSLEYNLFPKLCNNRQCYGFITESEVIDIGTPERYKRANSLLTKNDQKEYR